MEKGDDEGVPPGPDSPSEDVARRDAPSNPTGDTEPEPEHAPASAPGLALKASQPYDRVQHVDPVPSPAQRPRLSILPMIERQYDFFINHCQSSGADQCRSLALLLQMRGATVWYDMSAENLTAHGMEEGVASSRNVLIFLSDNCFGRPYCNMEQRWGIQYGCNFVGVVEKDDRHDPADFAIERERAPEDLKHLLEEIEFETYQRREHLVQAMISEILKRGGCTGILTVAGESDAANDADEQQSLLAVVPSSTDANNELLEASIRGDIPRAQQAIALGANLTDAKTGGPRTRVISGTLESRVTENGMCAIHWAAYHGHAEMVQYILDQGIEVDQSAGHGRTPLYFAALHGQSSTANLLLITGAKSDQADLNGVPPLYGARVGNHVEVAVSLVRAGANPALKPKGAVGTIGSFVVSLVDSKETKLTTAAVDAAIVETTVNSILSWFPDKSRSRIAATIAVQARERAIRDHALVPGTRLRIAPHGEGVYERWEKSVLGSNNHFIRFASGLKKIALSKLQAAEWCVVPEQPASSQLPSAAIVHSSLSESLEAFLADAQLSQYADAITHLEYVELDDLMDADDDALQELVVAVGMSEPAAKRFLRKLLDHKGGCSIGTSGADACIVSEQPETIGALGPTEVQ